MQIEKQKQNSKCCKLRQIHSQFKCAKNATKIGQKSFNGGKTTLSLSSNDAPSLAVNRRIFEIPKRRKEKPGEK